MYEYVVCRLFPLTFEGKALYLFNVLPTHSVHSWSQFKRLFENDFDDYNPIKEYQDLSDMQVDDGESINDFNIRFR